MEADPFVNTQCSSQATRWGGGQEKQRLPISRLLRHWWPAPGTTSTPQVSSTWSAAFIMRKWWGVRGQAKYRNVFWNFPNIFQDRSPPPRLNFPSQAVPRSLPNPGTRNGSWGPKRGDFLAVPAGFFAAYLPLQNVLGAIFCHSREGTPGRPLCAWANTHVLESLGHKGLTVDHVTWLWKAEFIKMTSTRWLLNQSNTILLNSMLKLKVLTKSYKF